jgi:hypothetical protein
MRIASALLAICCCLSAAGGRWQETMTALPDEHQVSSGAAVAPALPARARVPFNINIGTLDTIGGTTHDWQTNGPAWRTLVNSPGHGVHATWMYSASTTGTDFSDRNMRYNYYDPGWGWNWIDPYYVESGVNVFAQRAGYGSMDAEPSGEAVISCHYATGLDVSPMVARDLCPGAGIFEYADGLSVLGPCQWPPVSVSGNGTINILPLTTAYDLSYSHIAPDSWPNWSTPVSVANPGFPSHSIAASKQSGKICLLWVVSTDNPQVAYMRTSTDYGATWTPSEQLPTPEAYGGDTVTSFHITSPFPFYDNDDRLNIVSSVLPEVNDTAYIMPARILHYCPDNTPKWNLIQSAGCDPANLQASIGYNATYAGRPTIGQDEYGDLFVAWEQFDSANVEARTSRLRADVWAAGSTDGGLNWSTPLKLTTAETTSCRFPSISDLVWPGDSLAVLYEVDQCAGFFVMAEGPATENPIVVQKVPVASIIERGPYFGRLKEPNGGESLQPGDTFAIRWIAAPRTFDHGVLSLSTDGGNTFPTVLSESVPSGETTFLWDPIPPLSCALCRVKFEAKDSVGATVFSDVSYRNFRIDSVLTSVAENRPEPGPEARPAPTVIRGVLVIPVSPRPRVSESPCLLDACGRKVMDLRPGANDIRMLAPGVYFITQGLGIRGEGSGKTRKIVLTE